MNVSPILVIAIYPLRPPPFFSPHPAIQPPPRSASMPIYYLLMNIKYGLHQKYQTFQYPRRISLFILIGCSKKASVNCVFLGLTLQFFEVINSLLSEL